MVGFIYIHIPFCVRKCLYCDFYSISSDERTMAGYVSALCREMELRSDVAGKIEAVYIGGGTPSILGKENISRLITCLGQNFSLSENAEITIEANPESLTEGKAELMRALGINRISIGMQSLDDGELSLLGRPHESKTATEAFHLARYAGFDNISVDLIYAIPGQTLGAWMETVARVVELAPEHISAYELTPEKHTPLSDWLKRGDMRLCEEEEIESMYYAGKDFLARNGYEHYEISNYALAGRECRHNLNYWNRGEYLGFGAGASSFSNECRRQNVRDVRAYTEGIEQGSSPLAEDIEMDERDRLLETIFLGLRKTEGLDIRLIPRDSYAKMIEALRVMAQQDLVRVDGMRLMLTRKGLLLCNEIIVRLMLCID
jgi:oxygen-independent coproporphyrinogen III oxidase